MDQQTPVGTANDSLHTPPSHQQPQPVTPHSSAAQPPNPNPNNHPPPSRQPNPAGRLNPQGFPRTTWQHPHFSPFSSTSSSPAPSLPASAPASASSPRASGGMAIGVPASTVPYPSSFGLQHFARGQAALSEPVSAAPSSQARPVQIRPGMVANPHHPRPVQSVMRSSPSTSSNPPGGPSTSSPTPSNAAKGMPTPRQPWIAAAPQGGPPLPVPPSHRPQMTSSQGHPRSITAQLQQQRQSLSSTPQTQPALPSSHQPPEHPGEQFPQSKLPRAPPQQQQVPGVQGSASQKQASPATMQANTIHMTGQNKANMEKDESCTRILSKRTIHELVSQIDPLERLDPDVEDILIDIADDFVDSITTFGCSLAKHRKSDRLEAKDILLHLERNWNIVLPGFGGDEIKTYRKPFVNDIHKERLAAIKKTVLVSDTVNAKNAVAQVAGNAKTNQSKAPASALLSPK